MRATATYCLQRGWWARQDSNLGPTDYESAALTAELRAPFLHHPTPKELADIGEYWLKEFKSRRLLGQLCRSRRGTKCSNMIPGGHTRCSLTVAHAWWRPWVVYRYDRFARSLRQLANAL